eukprot:CAMPEP_0113586876 /NCGR_PEP_ID=MMETSP0015_2-20120614/34556_1 /TAXON_ID=2838 /ORGANISM="Odontella" /LENGTH=55 /DNA_ID=CAMNT_0000492393 /DNA_START=29 /DNA_END=193 /DNA_ORIENTATION=+ /assembly_acc=CAM_ASM_000160
MMMDSATSPFLPELKPGGSDYNLFWSSVGGEDLASAPVFPGGLNLSAWRNMTQGG